jgi:radical SAM superfamily enzyme YgiQ (UPF0313 family)
MKIALISPKGAFLSADPEFAKFWENAETLTTYRQVWSGISLGLLVIAALTPKHFELKFIDENFEDIDFDKSYDLVGISAMTQQATRAYQIADEFRKRGIKVVIGGIHATVLPEEAKQHADSVIVGEAEETWPRFIEDCLNGNVQPFYRTTESIDLAKSPIPRYDLLQPQNYKTIWIQATRGCPRDCEFCVASKVYGLKYRHKTVEQVVREIEYVKKIWENAKINFADDNMFVDRKYSAELVKRLMPLKVKWSAQTDVSVAQDEDFLELIRRSGCISLFIGFESLSKENFNSLDRHRWKLQQLEKYPAVIRRIQSYGIGVMGAFIIGFDNDDTSIFKKTMNFIIKNRLFAAQVTILTPLPGTRLREKLKKEERVLNNDWKCYTGFDVNFIPKQIPPQVLQQDLLKVYRGIYNKEIRLQIAKHFKDIYLNLADRNSQIE